ncbi:MAG: serine/threonine-protein kinase [Candidatus Micrarchaeia archaeon]
MHNSQGPKNGSKDAAATRMAKAGKEIDKFKLEFDDPLVRETIHDKWYVEGKLGGGGMGTVFLVTELATGNKYAMKVISEVHSEKKEMEKRFDLEAIALARLNHPNIVQVYALDSFGKNRFCVMELLEGVDLSKVLKKSKSLPWEIVKPIMMSVCGAVAAAHDEGIMHRDLKPANIFRVRHEGKDLIKVLDFGLAKYMQSDETKLTQTGFFLGTASYAAPEQAWGGGEYDHRVDIYAMGVVMYELLTGIVPFKGKDPLQTLTMHKEKQPVPPREINPDIPAEVEEVILKALEKDPANRYQTALEMSEAIGRCHSDISAPAAGGSDDLFIADMMSEPSHVTKRTGAQPAVIEPEEPATESADHIRDYVQRRERKGVFGKLMGTAVTLSVLGAIGFAAYHYRDELIGRYKEYTAPSRPVPAPRPHPSGSVPIVTGREVTIRTDQPGARIFVAGGRYLGETARTEAAGDASLSVRLERGEERLFVWFGNSRRIVNVGPDQSSITISRNGAQRPQRPPHTAPSADPQQDLPQDDQPSDNQ